MLDKLLLVGRGLCSVTVQLDQIHRMHEQPNRKLTINPEKTAEKDLIISMVAYLLRDNPTVNEDLNVFRFICRNGYVLEHILHTRATIDTIK